MIKTMSVEINKLQKILIHCGETHLKSTANAYGIKSFGNYNLVNHEPLARQNKDSQQTMACIKQHSRIKAPRQQLLIKRQKLWSSQVLGPHCG
jgi:hypothetical protein